MPTIPIKQFGPIQSLTESTEVGVSLTRATNILLRPNKGFRGIPLYYRLFGIGNTVSVQSTLRALTYLGTAIGDTSGHRSTNKTVAIQVECQAKNFLLFYDLTATAKPCRGWFYLGEKGTVPSTLNLDAGTVTYTVLAVGLNVSARWYGTRAYSEWLLGNGHDENVIVQLNRTATPGVWRKAGSNVKPAAPSIVAVAPSKSGLTAATWSIDTRLKLTANTDNYPGISGNNRIRVTITPTVAALTSVLTGTGTPTTDPFNYAITGGASQSGTSAIEYPNASAIRNFINSDTKILTVLDALLTSTDAPISSAQGPTYLSGGAGTGLSEGFTDRVVTVIARYWDPGQEGLGYEGISSDESNTLTILSSQNFDVRVTVTPDANAEGGRFPFIRVFLNFIDDAGNEIFSLMNPTDPIPNVGGGSGTFRTANSGSTLYTVTNQVNAQFPGGGSSNIVMNITNYPIGSTIIWFTTPFNYPGGITAGTPYYVVYSTGATIRIATTLGGTPMTFPDFRDSVFGYTPVVHGLSVNDVIVPTSVPIAPFALNGTYYVVSTPSTTTLTLSATTGGTALSASGSSAATYTQIRIVQLGTNSEVGQAMSEDQNRPLPHTHHSLAAQQTWRAGVTGYQERLYASKIAPIDEPVPEGCASEDFTSVQSTSSAAGSSEITAVYTDGQWLHMHTPAGILLVDPENPTNPAREPQVGTGAINGATMVAMPDRRIFYVGSDLSLMAFDASIQLQEIVGNATVASAAATAYLRARVDTNAIAANNDRAHAYLDNVGQLLWLYLPGTTAVSNGELIGFAYDLINNGIVGEFTFPRCYASTMMEKTRPEITFVDEDGNMLYTDPTNQPDHSDSYPLQIAAPASVVFTVNTSTDVITTATAHGLHANDDVIRVSSTGTLPAPLAAATNYYVISTPTTTTLQIASTVGGTAINLTTAGTGTHSLTPQPAFTPQATGTAIPVADNGFGNVIYDAGAGNLRYLRAYTSYLETGYWDLGDPASRKAFMAFCWRTIAGSRAIMSITLESLSGDTATYTLGDVGTYGCNHRAPLMMSDSAIKAKITILSAQQKSWAVRDCGFDWLPQTYGSL